MYELIGVLVVLLGTLALLGRRGQSRRVTLRDYERARERLKARSDEPEERSVALRASSRPPRGEGAGAAAPAGRGRRLVASASRAAVGLESDSPADPLSHGRPRHLSGGPAASSARHATSDYRSEDWGARSHHSLLPPPARPAPRPRWAEAAEEDRLSPVAEPSDERVDHIPGPRPATNGTSRWSTGRPPVRSGTPEPNGPAARRTGRAVSPSNDAGLWSLVVGEWARIAGVFERRNNAPIVEANARLTGTTGLVLIVLLFFEGLTLPFIVRLLSWHIVIGLALIPPLLVKSSSVLYRFIRYYLGDRRYREAGPPHPLLRALGPVVFLSTWLLIASGVALWIEGPSAHLLFRVHQLTFFLWFAVVAVHVIAHIYRATRLGVADALDAKKEGPIARGAHRRRRVVVASLALGLTLGIAGRIVVPSAWVTPIHATSHTSGVHH